MAIFSSAMVLFAHPDDAEFMCGGTVARWSREGCEVHYVVATDGSAGSNEPGTSREAMRPVREREQRAAADALGVRTVTFLGELDGFLEVNPGTRKKVCREVRRLKPEVIVAPDPSRMWFGDQYINHKDHKAAGELALTAIMPDAPTRVMFQELEQEGLEPYEVPNLYLSVGEPEVFVDISDSIETKIEALACHGSQLDIDEVEPWIRERAKLVAEMCGEQMTYAEGFKVFRFVDDPIEAE
jgi:LmbE family N-acetylglucosaminyl deacetylase